MEWQNEQQSAAVSAGAIGLPGMFGPNPLPGSSVPQCPTSAFVDAAKVKAQAVMLQIVEPGMAIFEKSVCMRVLACVRVLRGQIRARTRYAVEFYGGSLVPSSSKK